MKLAKLLSANQIILDMKAVEHWPSITVRNRLGIPNVAALVGQVEEETISGRPR